MTTNKQQVFVEKYLVYWNATRAAIEAGYSEKTAYSQGQRLLKNVEIQEEVEKRISESAMDADEVLSRLSEIARHDIGEFLTFRNNDIEEPYIDLKKARELDKLGLIRKLKYNAQGKLEVEFYDKQTALVQLGKHLGLFTDKIEHSGPGGGPIAIKEVIVELPEEGG